MMFKYDIEIAVEDNETVRLAIELPDQGTASHSVIDLPGPNDLQCPNECSETLGPGADLKIERSVIFTKAVNLDEAQNFVRINYLVNNTLVLSHENPKRQDPSPLIKINIKFK